MSWNSPFRESVVLSSKYGASRKYTIKGKLIQDIHKGSDYVPKSKRPIKVYAAREGTVYAAKWDNNRKPPNDIGWGLYVSVQTKGLGYLTYAHLSKVYVKAGQKVKAGELIGVMGSSGQATGLHCHIEARRVQDNAATAFSVEKQLNEAINRFAKELQRQKEKLLKEQLAKQNQKKDNKPMEETTPTTSAEVSVDKTKPGSAAMVTLPAEITQGDLMGKVSKVIGFRTASDSLTYFVSLTLIVFYPFYIHKIPANVDVAEWLPQVAAWLIFVLSLLSTGVNILLVVIRHRYENKKTSVISAQVT